jgi:hypothetical protein
VPDEPVPDDAAGLRAANAGLRAVVEARAAENALLRAGLDAARERERRLELRLAELERRLAMFSALDEYRSFIRGAASRTSPHDPATRYGLEGEHTGGGYCAAPVMSAATMQVR